MTDSEFAERYLTGQGCTLVYKEGDKLLFSREKGVKPLLGFLEAGESFAGGAAADKVVGRGAAFLHVLLGTKVLYAEVVSSSAEEVLKRFGICYRCARRAAQIMNREGTGPCPMELATQDITDPEEALCAIKRKLEELRKGKIV